MMKLLDYYHCNDVRTIVSTIEDCDKNGDKDNFAFNLLSNSTTTTLVQRLKVEITEGKALGDFKEFGICR